MSIPLNIQARPLTAVGADWPRDLDPLLDRIYRGRGLRYASELDLKLERLPAPEGLSGLPQAVARLAEAIVHDQPILVVGDFDADGATGTALAVRGLRMLGARQVAFRVPDRMRHGYGLSTALVEEITPLPAVLVTVDQGTSSVAGVALAQSRGVAVIVTDHHLPGPQLPPAHAIVNPNLDGEAFPGQRLSGVGVMFYVLVALRQHLRARGRFAGQPEPRLAALLDLVALGTVADLVPLDGLNRTLVQHGLGLIRSGRAHVGVLALFQVAGRSHARAQASDLGFLVAPRINAAGRLDDMAIGIRCLLSDDQREALALAQTLDTLNRERREWQEQMQAQAIEAVQQGLQRLSASKAAGADVLVLADAQWHAGVVGLVASRLVERFHRPAFVFAPGGDDGLWRGSARSIPGLHLRDAIALTDTRHPGLIERFGGHAMAAGLSVRPAALPALQLALGECVGGLLDAQLLDKQVWTDGSLPPQRLDLHTAELLRSAGPFGQQFPPPLFDDLFHVLEQKLLKGRHRKLRVRHHAGGQPLDALWFNSGDRLLPATAMLRLLYTLEPSEYRGLWTPQLLIQHVLPAA